MITKELDKVYFLSCGKFALEDQQIVENCEYWMEGIGLVKF